MAAADYGRGMKDTGRDRDVVTFLSLQPPAEFRIWGWLELGTGRGWQSGGAPHHPAMASALTVLFLGCWLAGQSRAGERELESEPNSAIIAGVIVGAAGLFLLFLFLAFLCRRCTRARKGPASRQSRESEATTTVYALAGHGKQQDVLPQEPDLGAEGLTYTELDHQALQAKRDAPASAPEPVLYATVTRSQGAPPQPPSPEPGRVTETTGQGALPPGSDAVTPPGEQAQLMLSP